MATVDPYTGRALPADAIQRVLFVCAKVHVYQIPPLTSTKGFQAGPWTALHNPTAKQIFEARLRILETSSAEVIKVDILLEDSKTGELFAAAPYTTPAAVQSALDSSRFFAIRVSGEGGMKATLGIGFEERADAFDFGIALGDERKVLGLDGDASTARQNANVKAAKESKQDFSLKEGESIHIELGGKGHRSKGFEASQPSPGTENSALFSIAPPPSGPTASIPTIAPPPNSSSSSLAKDKAQELGFDDGEFGEFQ